MIPKPHLKTISSAAILTAILSNTSNTDAQILIGADDGNGNIINTDVTDTLGNPLTPDQITTTDSILLGNTTDGQLHFKDLATIPNRPKITVGNTETANGYLTFDNTNTQTNLTLNQGTLTLKNQSTLTPYLGGGRRIGLAPTYQPTLLQTIPPTNHILTINLLSASIFEFHPLNTNITTNLNINISDNSKLIQSSAILNTLNTTINMKSGSQFNAQNISASKTNSTLNINLQDNNTKFISKYDTNFNIGKLNLNISNHAKMNIANNLNITTNLPNATSNINLSNNASLNLENGNILITNKGDNTNSIINLASGATINASKFTIKYYNPITSKNTISITDPNTRLTLTNQLSLYDTDIKILNGATLDASQTNKHLIGHNSTVNISGNNATLNLGNASVSSLSYEYINITATQFNATNTAKINTAGFISFNAQSTNQQTINIKDPGTIWKNNGAIYTNSIYASTRDSRSSILNLSNQATLITRNIAILGNSSPTDPPSALNISGQNTTLSAVQNDNFNLFDDDSLFRTNIPSFMIGSVLNLTHGAILNTPKAYLSYKSNTNIKDTNTTWNAYEIFARGNLAISNGATVNIANKFVYHGNTSISSTQPELQALTITGQNTTLNLGHAQTIVNTFEQEPQVNPTQIINPNATFIHQAGNLIITDGAKLNTPNLQILSTSRSKTNINISTPNAINTNNLLIDSDWNSPINFNFTPDQNQDPYINIANDLTLDHAPPTHPNAQFNILTDNLDDLSLNDTFILFNISGQINRKFVNIPENQILAYANNLALRLTYQGGDGNDIALITTAAPELGDLNEDGQINQLDLNLTIQHFGTNSSQGDANHDNTVNLQDIFLLRNILNTNTPLEIPEPTTLFTLLILAPALLARRK